jgi:hypothetical protein
VWVAVVAWVIRLTANGGREEDQLHAQASRQQQNKNSATTFWAAGYVQAANDIE